MDAKLIQFGPRNRKARAPMTEATRKDLVELLLKVGARVEAGELSSLYLIVADHEDKTESWMTYHSDAIHKVLTEINSLKKYAIERMQKGEK